jgi:four helix bundle protein
VESQAEELKSRTKRFALDVLELLKALPTGEPAMTIRRQLAKSATSVHINYRAACRARTHAEFTAKIGIVAEETDETTGWLDIVEESRLISMPELSGLQREARELRAIFSRSASTARRNRRLRSSRP